jgi:protein TonB
VNKKRPVNPVKSAINLYMVKASVFFENKIYLRAIDRVTYFKKYMSLKLGPILAYCSQQLHQFQYWLVNPAQLKANGGIATFSYDSQDARKTFIFVALVHAVFFVLVFSLSQLQDKKIPDVMIELGDAPKSSNGSSQSIAESASNNSLKDAPKAASTSENVDTEILKERELKRLERQKELEIERERKKELEREKQKQKERERELNLERVREQEQERQRMRELELEKKRELERERQRAKELEQEKKREQDRAKEQERQQQLRERQQQKQEEKLREKLPEPRKLEKDGTLPPPPSSAPSAPSAAAPSAPSSSSSPPPPSSSAASSSTAASAPPQSGGASSSSGSSGSMSASVSNGPASAPTMDSEPKALTQSNPKPAYPLLAYKMKIQGKVILIVDVAESGSVNKVTVAESSGNELLDRSALDTVKGWKFTPARKNGVIVSQVIRVPITFSLKNH